MTRSLRSLAVSTVAVAAALGMSACGEDEPLDPPGQVQDGGNEDDGEGGEGNEDDGGDDGEGGEGEGEDDDS